MKCYKTRRVYKPANNNGIFGSVALFDIINSPEYEELLKLTYRSKDNVKISDPILSALIEEKGFDALPVLVDDEHYDLLIRSKLREIYRGVKIAEPAKDFALNPKMFVGRGLYCNGVYFAYGGAEGKEIAEKFLNTSGMLLYDKDENNDVKGDVFCALMSKDTKVVEIGELLKIRGSMKNYVNKQSLSHSTKDKIIRLISRDLSVVAILNGYDAIDIKDMKYMVILNRSKIIMKNPEPKEKTKPLELTEIKDKGIER